MVVAPGQPCTRPGCGRADTRPYLRGALCPDHEPHVPVPPPWTGPARTPVEPLARRRPADDPTPTLTAPTTAHAAALVARVQGAAARAPRHAADPYVRDGKRATSMGAAIRALPKSGTHRRAVLDALYRLHELGAAGATDVQLAHHLGLTGNTVRPRRGELVEQGLVEDSGTTRVHDGNPHTVWRVTNAAVVAIRRA